jgi:hypothetical protein
VTDGDDERRGGENWHDSQAAVVAGGLAALVLLGLLGYGVTRVSRDSVERPNVVYPSTSVATTPASGLKTPTSTSYPVPSVQTSQAIAPPVTGPPVDTPSEDPGGSGATPDTPTTIYNPYTTTTSTNAGHI